MGRPRLEAIDQAPNWPPFIPWDAFVADFTRAWKQGEHASVIGPTGQGKSVLLTRLLEERRRRRGAHIVIFATKPRDKTMTGLGWPIVKDWPASYGQYQVVLWPTYGDPTTAARRQRAVFLPVLRQLFKDGKRTIAIDEVADFEERLGLKSILNEFWKMGRAMQITLVAGTQRPRGVSRAMFSEPSWVFFFRTNDEDELRRVGEIGGTDSRLIRDVIRSLEPHEFLCVRTRTGEMARSRVEL